MPVIPSSGTLETLNLGQFVELVMYLLSSEASRESVALQGLAAMSCVHRLDPARLLFDRLVLLPSLENLANRKNLLPL